MDFRCGIFAMVEWFWDRSMPKTWSWCAVVTSSSRLARPVPIITGRFPTVWSLEIRCAVRGTTHVSVCEPGKRCVLRRWTRSPAGESKGWATRRSSVRSSLRSEEHTSELQSPDHLVCRLLLEKKKKTHRNNERQCGTCT